MFLWVAASVTEAAAVNPHDIKKILPDVLNTFPIKGNTVFSKGTKPLPRNSPDCSTSWNCIFDNFLLAVESFARGLQSFETCVLGNNNLYVKVFLSLESPTTFDESFKLSSVSFFDPDFSLLRYRLDNLYQFLVLYGFILYWYQIKTKKTIIL